MEEGVRQLVDCPAVDVLAAALGAEHPASALGDDARRAAPHLRRPVEMEPQVGRVRAQQAARLECRAERAETRERGGRGRSARAVTRLEARVEALELEVER